MKENCFFVKNFPIFRLYDKVNETDNAAAVFTEYCLKEDDVKDKVFEDQTEYYNALQYLANYHLNKGNLEDAYTFAYKCIECEEVNKSTLLSFCVPLIY